MSKFDITVQTEDYESIKLSDYDNNLWLSVWKIGSHCSANLTRDQVIELRNALNQFLAMNEVANTAESA
jgi:hypothetical protein